MATYVKAKSGNYNVAQLQVEINADAGIVPSCTSISGNGEDITLEFAASLSTSGSPIEETILDRLVADHIPQEQTIDVSQLHFSDIDNKKLAVHPSYKPKSGKQNYAVWTGAGDDLTQSPSGLGEGPLLDFHMEPQTGSPYVMQEVTIELKFDPVHGRVWVHEGYLQFNNGGSGDYMESWVMAGATPVQTFVDKILIIEDNWIKYAIGSPNPATHGWGGTPTLVPRTFSKDGDWDYDGVSLTPNFTGTGEYKISNIQRVVHKFFNKIPCCGTSPYFSMTSDETTELPAGYFIRTTAFNVSNTTWNSSILIEIYRERTFLP